MRKLGLVSLLVAVGAMPAWAHVGDVSHSHGFGDGLLHPMAGLDHLAVMIAIGVWAARQEGRQIRLVPAAFVSGMAIGIVQGLPFIPGVSVELAVSLSVVALGVLLALAVKTPAWAAALLAAVAGLVHGAAHAGEGPLQGGFSQFAIGALIATATLHALGVLGGVASRRFAPAVIRVTGAAMAVLGAGLTLGVI